MSWHNTGPMVARIGPKRPLKVYLTEWREKAGITQKQLGARLEPPVSDVTISRYETGERRPDLDALAALAEALDIAPEDLYRHPDQPSADQLLRGQPAEVREEAMKIIRAIRR